MDAYTDDLAYIHDVGFGDFARGAAPGLLDILRHRGITQGLVVDLGCGSGLWAQVLTEAGFDVLGIDQSVAMLAMARQRVPHGVFHTGSFLHADLPSCVAMTALGEVFNYQFDGRNSMHQLNRLFRRVYTALQPGGLFIFDIATPGRGTGPRLRCREGADWVVLIDVEEEQTARRLTRRITFFRKVGELYRRGHETHVLQLYTRSDMATALRHVGFLVRTLHAYGQYPLLKGCAGFVARKPA